MPDRMYGLDFYMIPMGLSYMRDSMLITYQLIPTLEYCFLMTLKTAMPTGHFQVSGWQMKL